MYELGERKYIINREMRTSILLQFLLHTPELTRWVRGILYTGTSRSEPKGIE
jgi:hypothetical protein